MTQESNPHLLHLLHWQADSSPLCHSESLLTAFDDLEKGKNAKPLRLGLCFSFPDTLDAFTA